MTHWARDVIEWPSVQIVNRRDDPQLLIFFLRSSAFRQVQTSNYSSLIDVVPFSGVPRIRPLVHELSSRLFPSPSPIRSSITSHFRALSHPFFLSFSNYTRQRSFSYTFFNTSSSVLYSVQLVLSILFHIHISKASIRATSSFLIVHVSVPCSVTLHFSALTIIFLMSLLSPPFNNSFLFRIRDDDCSMSNKIYE